MEAFVMTLGFAVLPSIVLYQYLRRYRLRRRSLREGLAAFDTQSSPSGCAIDVTECYPLSEHMIKELAVRRGLRYTGRARDGHRLGPMHFAPDREVR
ncbi:hypothetical protein [Haloechinothrix sp. LS1_15]|uniref:hypothetical protein n=1 Tax=Haloechinothrix sp. LS1_15 TaxID=2652248 RepID=UPI002944930A|nr:hypothetical protein [Haloechinothrix sp. LS1_15]MDV6011098.1 hypothetical protein [Haloechinothrix sp. LS1_15]